MSTSPTKLFSIKNKVIIVTGGAGFLGKKYVRALASAGAKVVVWDRIGKNSVDITDESAVQNATADIIKKHGRIDVLINNAAMNPAVGSGASKAQFAPYEEYPIKLWENELQVNLTGMMICTKAVAPTMMRQKSGSIINVASELSVIAHNQSLYKDSKNRKFKSIAYTTTKAAALGFTIQWAARLGSYSVRVNTFSPTGIEKKDQPSEFVARYGATTMLGRMAKPKDCLGPIIFLCSDASSYLTGANLVVDGGRTAW